MELGVQPTSNQRHRPPKSTTRLDFHPHHEMGTSGGGADLVLSAHLHRRRLAHDRPMGRAVISSAFHLHGGTPSELSRVSGADADRAVGYPFDPRHHRIPLRLVSVIAAIVEDVLRRPVDVHFCFDDCYLHRSPHARSSCVVLKRPATAIPASHPGARPFLGGCPAADRSPAFASTQEVIEFEFHISPVCSSSRPHTGVGTSGRRSNTWRISESLTVIGTGLATACGRSGISPPSQRRTS